MVIKSKNIIRSEKNFPSYYRFSTQNCSTITFSLCKYSLLLSLTIFFISKLLFCHLQIALKWEQKKIWWSRTCLRRRRDLQRDIRTLLVIGNEVRNWTWVCDPWVRKKCVISTFVNCSTVFLKIKIQNSKLSRCF